MAIVKNRAADPDVSVDRNYCTHSRAMAGSPNASLTPAFVGEIVWDTTNKVRWKSVALANTDWTPLGPEVT